MGFNSQPRRVLHLQRLSYRKLGEMSIEKNGARTTKALTDRAMGELHASARGNFDLIFFDRKNRLKICFNIRS